MDDIEARVRQCRKPSDKQIGQEMNAHHFELWNWGLEHIDIAIDPISVIIDLGCGGGRAMNIMAQKKGDGKIVGVDYSTTMLELSRQIDQHLIDKGQIFLCGATVSCLPFKEDSFDLATAFETCYFWPDLASDVKEIGRILRPGGKFLIVNEMYDHAQFYEYNSKFSAIDGMNIYSSEFLKNTLEAAGFSEVEVFELVDKNWITVVATV